MEGGCGARRGNGGDKCVERGRRGSEEEGGAVEGMVGLRW